LPAAQSNRNAATVDQLCDLHLARRAAPDGKEATGDPAAHQAAAKSAQGRGGAGIGPRASSEARLMRCGLARVRGERIDAIEAYRFTTHDRGRAKSVQRVRYGSARTKRFAIPLNAAAGIRDISWT
jgi:hypothetical protein